MLLDVAAVSTLPQAAGRLSLPQEGSCVTCSLTPPAGGHAPVALSRPDRSHVGQSPALVSLR